MMERPDRYRGIISVLIAMSGFMLFSLSLVFLIAIDFDLIPVFVVPLGTLWMTGLFTGLFITVHDSMHTTIAPGNRKLNDLIGAISIFFYAMFSYSKLKKKHFLHHKHPATSMDPDYHNGRKSGFLSWYFRFLGNYLSWPQILGMAILFNALFFLAGLSWKNLLAFWIIPSLLSTLQLFYFGTYLPHKEPPGGYDNKHHARSSGFPWIISLLTCFHFGYHLEHHMFPYVQWWRLPGSREFT